MKTLTSAVAARVQVGDRLPEYVQGPISRTTLALYAGASHDHVPLHIDIDFARRAGMPDVFAHGMLSMAYLAQMLTRWVPQPQLRSMSVRFVGITHLHATVHCEAEVTELPDEGEERCARLKISARTGDGTPTLEGEAVVALVLAGSDTCATKRSS